jgi:hypothetical protein
VRGVKLHPSTPMTHTDSTQHRKNPVGRGRAKAIVVAAVLLQLTSPGTAAEPLPVTCDLRLLVELTPDVPDPREGDFLSSLLGNHVNYRLAFQQQNDDSVFVLELIGPGPTYACQKVVDDMGRDGRVLSIEISDGPS